MNAESLIYCSQPRPDGASRLEVAGNFRLESPASEPRPLGSDQMGPHGLVQGVCRVWDKSPERARDFVARQSAATDKLLKPPRGGGKAKEKSDFRSAERCLTSLSRQIPAIPIKFPEEDMVFISESDRLLVGGEISPGGSGSNRNARKPTDTNTPEQSRRSKTPGRVAPKTPPWEIPFGRGLHECPAGLDPQNSAPTLHPVDTAH